MEVVIESVPKSLQDSYSQKVIQMYEPIAEGTWNTFLKLPGFHNVSVRAMNALVETIFQDLREALGQLFHKEW